MIDGCKVLNGISPAFIYKRRDGAFGNQLALDGNEIRMPNLQSFFGKGMHQKVGDQPSMRDQYNMTFSGVLRGQFR